MSLGTITTTQSVLSLSRNALSAKQKQMDHALIFEPSSLMKP